MSLTSCRKFFRIFTILLLTALMCTGAVQAPNVAYADIKPPEIEGAAGILMDARTGEVLFSKDADIKYEPASTTKMITAILVIENLDLNKKIKIEADDLNIPGSRLPMAAGEKIKTEDLLYALMLNSANNCAYVLGKAVAGSNDEFVKMMNEKAREIGAENTIFLNPHGLPTEGHLSTAYDLALIGKYCMANPQFAKIVKTVSRTIPPTDLFSEQRELKNTNRLLFDETNTVIVNGKERGYKYAGITGIKTGSTDYEHGSLVASANRKGTTLIAVSLASTEVGRFADCIKMLDYGFERYYSYKVLTKKTVSKKTQKVTGGKVGKVGLSISDDLYVTLPREASKDIIRTEYNLPKRIKAPVKKGQKIGTLKVYESDMLTEEIDILAAEAVKRGGPLSNIGISDRLAIRIAIVAGIIVFLFLVLLIVRTSNIKKRRRRREMQRRQELMRLARERKAQEEYSRRRNWPTDRFK